MDLRTVMMLLAVGSFLFGLFLLVLKFNVNHPQEVPFWIMAKFSQAVGCFLLYLRVNGYDALSVLANITLILGCAYEAWAVRILTGAEVKRRLHLPVAAGIAAAILAALPLGSPYRGGVVFLLQSVFYLLPGAFLLHGPSGRSLLQRILGFCYLAASGVFLGASLICLAFPSFAVSAAGRPVFAVVPLASFSIFLIGGFILLTLAKERSDRIVAEMRKSLQQSQTRFQRVVETATEGILMFDEDFRITFANEKMASVLGYAIGEMVGRPYESLIPESHIQLVRYQEMQRRLGNDSIYECPLVGKDGKERWFIISATAIVGDSGLFEGSFAMLSDITERREMELALAESNRRLTEMSHTDSLTGIANRRLFDRVLEREYARLLRTKSQLSVILLDLDHFKDYNDEYGHVMGDACLRQIGAVLAECVGRSLDLAARYGGEEFACILPDTGLQASVEMAEKIRRRIAGLNIEHSKSPVAPYVTASFGVITVHHSPNLSPADIVNLADRMLYRAKAAGRNCIESAEWQEEGQAIS